MAWQGASNGRGSADGDRRTSVRTAHPGIHMHRPSSRSSALMCADESEPHVVQRCSCMPLSRHLHRGATRRLRETSSNESPPPERTWPHYQGGRRRMYLCTNLRRGAGRSVKRARKPACRQRWATRSCAIPATCTTPLHARPITYIPTPWRSPESHPRRAQPGLAPKTPRTTAHKNMCRASSPPTT